VDGRNGADGLELVEHGGRREIPGMHDEGGLGEEITATSWKLPRTAWEVRVGDDGDQNRSPRKRPSR
jgi:hypothetical protein